MMKLTFKNEFLLARDGVKTEPIAFKNVAKYREYADERAEKVLNRMFVKTFARPPQALPLFLDEHQREGIIWALTRSRSYLAHAPGAGKTCEAVVASIFAEGVGQTVFIVPPSLTKNWEREIAKFHFKTTGIWSAQISVLPKSAKQKDMDWNADYLVVADSMLTKPWVLTQLLKRKIRFLAVDEASRFKESTSMRTIALFGGKLGPERRTPGIIHGAKYAVLLDGSPMPNRPVELWAPTYAMCPESIDFMEYTDFGLRYGGPRMNDFGQWEFRGSSHEDELREKLQEKFMHVVPESALNHPERLRSILLMSEDVRSAEVKRWEKKVLARINLNDIDESLSRGELAVTRSALGEEKVEWIAQYVRERLYKNDAILLFAWHRNVVDRLAEALSDFFPVVVKGGTSEAEREDGFKAFQSGATDLIIGNISAMGRGHNLQRATRVVFGEYSWTDEMNKQCEKRTSRRGNESENVRCDYIVCPDSMDEVILQSVFRKAASVRRVIG